MELTIKTREGLFIRFSEMKNLEMPITIGYRDVDCFTIRVSADSAEEIGHWIDKQVDENG